MALNKIQSLIQKIAQTENVKKIIADVQLMTNEIQTKVQKLSADEAVKKYKELAKKVVAAENDLQKEVNKVVSQVKKSADEVEKNFVIYKKKAQEQRNKLEKMILAKTTNFSNQATPQSVKPSKSKKKMLKKTTRKKTVRK